MQKQTEWPRVGVGMITIHPEFRKILMGKRLSPYGYGTWNNPGGKLEFGEDPIECAIRETFEETNLIIDASSVHQLGYFNDKEVYDNNLERHWVTLMFAGFVMNPSSLLNKEPTKHSRWEWFDVGDWPDNMWQPMVHWWDTSPYAEYLDDVILC